MEAKIGQPLTGLRITQLGYGAMALDPERMAPHGLGVSAEDPGAVLNAVLDAGINFIDTSPDFRHEPRLHRPVHCETPS